MANNKVNIGVGFSVDKAGLEEMQSLFQRIANQAGAMGDNANNGLKRAGQTAQTLDKILEKTFNTDLGTLNVTKFNQELQKSGLTMKQVKTDLTAIGGQGATAYNRLAQAVMSTNIQLKQSSKLLDSMFTTFKNTVRYGISSSIFNNFTNSIVKAYEYTKKLDSSLNDIRIVTGKSADEMDRFAEKANKAAKQLGASTLDITEASLIYYQQGLSDTEAQARAETTVKVANVTKQSADEISEQLTAVWNGYKVSAEETELYIDKLAAVAATTAADLEELSTGMSKVASAAQSMGVDFDDLNAQIATIVSVTRQAPESVGTALKTIYARLGDLKVDGIDEFGVKLGEVSSQMQVMGIEILDQEGNMKDMSSVMAEVAEKWNTWTDAQRQAAAVAMAGKRQYNNLIALFNNWDMYSDALKTSVNAMGTLQKQQDIYMESTQAKLTKLRATWQDLYKSVGNTKTINTAIDGITNLVQVFDNFIDSFGGGLKSIFAFSILIANIFNKQIVNSINNAIQRSQILKNNIEAVKAQQEIAQAGVAKDGNSAYDQAVAAATSEQLRLLEQTKMVQQGLTQEQQNQLIGFGKEIALLTQEKVKQEEIAKISAQRYFTEEQIQQILNSTPTEVENILEYYRDIDKVTHDRQVALSVMADNLKVEEGKAQEILENTKKELETKRKLSQEEKIIHKQLQEILKSTNASNIKANMIKKLLKETEEESEKFVKNMSKAAEKMGEASKNSFNINEEMGNLQQEADDILLIGENALKSSASITTLTSTLSSMTMAWGSINSLFQTWLDDSSSFGDKITQTITTVGMTAGMVIPSLKKIYDVTTASLALKKKEIIQDELIEKIRKARKAGLDDETIKKTLLNGAYVESVKTKGLDVTLTEAEAEALMKDAGAQTVDNVAKEAGDKINKKATLSQLALNAARMADPIFITAAVLTGVVAATAFYISYQKKQIEEQKKLNEETVETVSKTLEEVDANKQLYDSLEQIYGEYKKGIDAKKDLADAAEKLAEKYNLEGVALANLTGNYDDLIEAAKRARKEELQKGIEETEKGLEAQADLIKLLKIGGTKTNIYDENTGDYTKEGRIISTPLLFGENKEKKSKTILSSLGANFTSGGGLVLPEVNTDDIESVKEYYDIIHSYYEALDNELSANDKKDSNFYKELKKIEEEFNPVIEKYKELEKANKDYKEQLVFNQVDFEQITSLEEYNEKIEEVKKAFSDLNKYTDEEIDNFISSYIKKSSNAVAQQAKAIEELGKKYSETIELSLSDKEFLISGKLDLDEIEGLTKAEIEERINIAKRQLTPEDLTIPISFMAKLTGGKLNKTEIKEYQEQEGSLAKKYDVEFSNFDSKSMLDQADIMNKIIQEEVANRKTLMETYTQAERQNTELYTKKVKEEEANLNVILEEKNRLEEEIRIFEAYGASSEEDVEKYNEAKEKLKEVNQQAKDLEITLINHKKLAEGMDFSEFESINFETWTTGIDATINSIKTLNSSIADIGEYWSIATDKIEEFAMNYPTILTDQENFNYLQDGSIALTEKGQKILQEQINLRKEDIKIQGEAYMMELQKQADLQYAQAQYYQDQIDALQNYLTGTTDAADTEIALRESVYNFSAKVAELTGKTNEEVIGQAIENSNINRKNEEQNEQAIFDYWVDCGEAVSQYGQIALSNGYTYTPPTPKALSGRNTGSNLSKESLQSWDDQYSKYFSYQLKDLNNMTEEEIAKVQSRINDLEKKRDASIARGDTELAKKASYGAYLNNLDSSIKNLGKGKSSKDKDKDIDDEFDRYYDIKKAIDLVGDALDKVNKIQEKLHGKQLIQSLKNENDLIKLQAENYKELYRQQQVELAEVQNALSAYGAEFDNNGFLTNYATLTSSILEDYKIKIAKASSDEAKTAYENAYEDFKKQLERYDTLYYNEMKETQDKLDEYNRKIMENNLKMWETEIQIKLDTQQAKRDWTDFLKEINDDFKKVYKDLNIEMDHLMTKMETYSGIGTIETDLQAVKDVMVEIDKLNSGQGSNMFESISDAQEKLKELDKQLEDDAKNMKQLWQEAWDTYLEGIDQADSKLDDLMDRFEKINQELEFQGKLVELLYGDEAYSLMDKLYKGQEQAMMNQIGSVKNQVDMWHQLWVESGATMDNQTEWTEDQKKYYEQWMELQNELNNLTTDYIELLQKDYLNTVNDILKKLEISISGQNLEDIRTQWGRITANTDKYYDDIEQAYEVQKFANKIDQDIAKATAKNQQKLQAIRDKEISYLREKENLTKYDLDAAEARYQIALKEIALEEAQQNKTSMKLVRNEEGNWSYQYMADADDVAQKQDDLLTSYGDLYKLAGDAYQDNLDSLQSLQETYLQSAKEINSDLTMSEEEKQNKLFELRTWYEDQYNKLAAENELYRQDLATSGAGLLLQVYEQDQTAYEYMTVSERAMLDNLISFSIESYQELENKIITNYNNINTESRALMAEVREDWTASAQQIADSWNADDGQSVKSQVLEAQNKISQAAHNYQLQVDELAFEVKRDFGPEGISGAIDQASQSTDNLKQSVQDLCTESANYLQGLKDIVNQVGQEFEAIVGTVQSAIAKVQEYLSVVGRAKSVSAGGYDITGGIASLGSYDAIGGGTGSGDGGDGSLEKWYVVGNDHYGAHGKNILHSNHTVGYDTPDAARKDAGESIRQGQLSGAISDVGLIQVKDLNDWYKGSVEATPFDTGGYTGAWDNTGKLAILHQKELVLNADDTANFLSGISLLRNMVSLNGSIEQSIAAAIGNMALQLNGIKAGSVGGVSQAVTTTNGDTYYVNAEFPNANNAEEIKQALLNLPNVVSQYIHKNGL